METEIENAIERAEKKHYRARLAYNGCKAERDARRSEKLREFTLELNRELDDEYGQTLENLRDAMNAAGEELDQARIAEASATGEAGKRYARWKFMGQWLGGWKDTGQRAITEIFVPGKSQVPENLAHYSIPQAGDPILRHLKTDGSPSLKFTTANFGGRYSNWFPEGVDPNKER